LIARSAGAASRSISHTDDPLIPVAEARFVASRLKCSYFEFDDRGHFSESRELPEALQHLKRKLHL
jgi:hypothetical protein